MKINNLQMEKVLKGYLRQKKTTTPEGNGSRKDQMQISDQAREVKKLTKKLNDLPEVRQEKVDRLKQQVQNGEYRVDSKTLARKILSDFRQEINDNE